VFDFPNTPSNGQTGTGTNGASYIYDGVKWKASPSASVSRSLVRLQAQWVNTSTVTDDTVWWWDMPYAGTINTLKYFTGNGSFTVTWQINGVTVTGLSGVVVSSATPATATATALNTFPAGANVSVVITGTTGSPTDALLSLAVTWS